MIRGSILCQHPINVFLRTIYLLLWHHYINCCISYLPGVCNEIENASSRFWEITDTSILVYFNSSFLQDKSWWISPLQTATLHYIMTVLHAKTWHREFHPPAYARTRPPGVSGANSPYGPDSTPTLLMSTILSPYSILFPTGSTLDSWKWAVRRLASAPLIIISARWDRYLPQWVPSSYKWSHWVTPDFPS